MFSTAITWSGKTQTPDKYFFKKMKSWTTDKPLIFKVEKHVLLLCYW